MGNKKALFLLTIIFCIVITIFLFQPGYMDNDSADQYQQSQNGLYNDWHPVSMSWLWSQVGHVCPGPICMFSLQVIIYWVGLAIFISLTNTHNVYKSLLLLIGFFPPTFMLLATVLKDVLMAVMFLLGASLILIATYKKNTNWLFASVFFIGYGMTLRHNALVAALPFLIYVGYIYSKENPRLLKNLPIFWRSISIGGMLFVFIYIAASIFNNTVTDIKRYPYQQIMLHDLVGISLRLKKDLVPEYVAATEQPSMGDLRDLYSVRGTKNLYWNDSTNIRFKILEDPRNVKNLAIKWLRTVIDYPRAYLIQRNVVFINVMNFNGLKNCAPYYYEETIYKPRGHYRPEEKPYAENPITNFLFSIIEPLRMGLLYRNWLYLLLTGAIGIVAFIQLRNSPEDSLLEIVFVLASSGLIYALMYFFVATACDFRMMYWSVIVTLVSIPALAQRIIINRSTK